MSPSIAPNALVAADFEPLAVDGRLPARLIVVVDTEEEFDWHKPVDRHAVGVTAVGELWRFQEVAQAFGVVPTYVVDYPIASTASSAEVFRAWAAGGVCDIGAHLHPWVNPPYVEDVSNRHSFACNLAAPVELAKISALRDAIIDGIGVVPRAYKAGRYGLGRSTVTALEGLGFDIDVSINPHMDFTSIEGPSFRGFTPAPSLFGGMRRMLELPCTTGFVGMARRSGEAWHALASRAERFKAVGILARLGVLNRIMLSPEGNRLDEMVALTRALYQDGLRTFAMTLHSPSLKPGCTPYVRSEAERSAFIDTIREYLSFFTRDLGGVPTRPSTLLQELRGAH